MEGLATLIVGRGCVERYQARISGPLLDRIDLQIEVPAVCRRTSCCRRRRREVPRFARAPRRGRSRPSASPRSSIRARAPMPIATEACSKISPLPIHAGRTLLHEAADALGLSARGYHRTLRVARTLADLDGEARVARIHIAEALSYRGETLRRAQAAA